MSCSRFAPVTLLQPHSCFHSYLLCFMRPSEGVESTFSLKNKIPWHQFDCLELSHSSHFGEVRERDPTLHLFTWRELARGSTWTGHGAARPDTSLRPGTAALLWSEVRPLQPLRPKRGSEKGGTHRRARERRGRRERKGARESEITEKQSRGHATTK